MKGRVLVSVYNISGYLISELTELSKFADVAVIEVPCLKIGKGVIADVVTWIDRRSLDVSRVLNQQWSLYLCCGWADRQCLDLARQLHDRGTKTILMVDTPWQGKLKQFIHCLYSRFYLTRIFDYAWGAGEPQERYLRYLGFSSSRIRRGYYCADTKKFAPIGEARLGIGKEERGGRGWPHVFLYIGRYVAVKNMRRMERAFIKAVEKEGAEESGKKRPWTLRCIGSGELWDERTIHPQIEHLGYKSPAEIQNYVKDAGCFVLPSVYEPWGVVVHEAALMGLPMLCSRRIQAATKYLRESENGYVFDPLCDEELVSAFLKIMRLSDDKLIKMGRESFRLGLSYTTEDWVKNVLEFAK